MLVPRSEFPVRHFKNIHFNLQLLSLLAQGQQGIVSPCGPQKQTCHSQAKCLSDKGKEQCRCNDGFQGDGTRCKGLCTVVAFQIPFFLAFNKKYQLNTLSKLPLANTLWKQEKFGQLGLVAYGSNNFFLSGEYKRVLTRRPQVARPQGRIFATGLTIVGLHFYKSLLECGRTFSGFSGPENSGM